MAAVIVDVFRGTQKGDGTYQDDPVPGYEGMVELDAVYSAQATSAPDLAVRWHGTAGTGCAAVCPEDIHSPDNAILPVIRAETTSWYHAEHWECHHVATRTHHNQWGSMFSASGGTH